MMNFQGNSNNLSHLNKIFPFLRCRVCLILIMFVSGKNHRWKLWCILSGNIILQVVFLCNNFTKEFIVCNWGELM